MIKEDDLMVWSCKVVIKKGDLPNGFDTPPRRSVIEAIESAGFEVLSCFSGWGAKLNKGEANIVLGQLNRKELWETKEKFIVEKWLNEVAYLGSSEVSGDSGDSKDTYRSKFDGSYIGLKPLIDAGHCDGYIKVLAEHGVTEQLTHGVGFSPSEQKWYGWSHRAIFGFEIGSTCKKGDCHYQASNIDDELESAESFWCDTSRKNVKAELESDGKTIKVSWENINDDDTIKSKIDGASWYYNLGNGEWTAETLEDAHQMAIDFNEGVS